jgi:RimJ/RimL family protein N-acetyltransferase
MSIALGRVRLRPLDALRPEDWVRVHRHFQDPEIAHLNGTPPNRLPRWLLRRVLKSDARRPDRMPFGVYDENNDYIGTVELYDLASDEATLGIIIGERSHWGRGYGTEAMRALLRHAFGSLGLSHVRLHTYGDNERALAAFRKVGFTERQRKTNREGRVDVHMDVWRDAFLESERRLEAAEKGRNP